VDSPLWKIFDKQRPEQPGLFPTLEIPLRVQIVISPDWANLLTAGATAQFLPFAELLGSIPGSQPSGAWARVIGLALMNFWRRHPAQVLAGAIQPARGELLQRYTPKLWPVEQLLASRTPKRVLEYWYGALQILAERGIIESTGEVFVTPKQHLESLPRYSWGGTWLEGKAAIHPGLLMREALEGRERALVAAQPKPRGRPRKSKP
jgi:hypothetical protein